MGRRLFIPFLMALIAWTGGAIWYGLSVVSGAGNFATQNAAADLAKSRSMMELLANLLVGGGVGTIVVIWSVVFTPLALLAIMARPRKQTKPERPKRMSGPIPTPVNRDL